MNKNKNNNHEIRVSRTIYNYYPTMLFKDLSNLMIYINKECYRDHNLRLVNIIDLGMNKWMGIMEEKEMSENKDICITCGINQWVNSFYKECHECINKYQEKKEMMRNEINGISGTRI